MTLIELTIVLLIGGVMASLATPPITATWERWQLLQARDEFVMAAAVARSQAVEQGAPVRMIVDAEAGRVVLRQNDGTDLETFDIGNNGRRIQLAGDDLTICYLPRGHAHPGCGSGPELPTAIGFASRRDTVWATLTLGRVEKQ